MEQVMQQLLSQFNPVDGANNAAASEPIPAIAANDAASSSAPFLDTFVEDEDDEGAPSTEPIVEEERDLEMEDELADELARVDALTDYDIDVTREGEAIHEYLALLDSADK